MKKRISIFALFLAAVALLTTSCGTSDYVESVSVSSTGTTSGGFYNLAGVDGTLQLQVLANYHSHKVIDVTNNSTWSVTPVGCATTADDPTFLCPNEPGAQSPGTIPVYGPTTVPISTTGLMTGIVQMCTWTDAIDPTTGKPASPADWEYTGYYQVTATYRNFTSQPVGIGVGVTASDNSPGCGPS